MEAPRPAQENATARPLTGVRVVEFAGLGPTPFAAMMLADMGAEVLRIERAWPPAAEPGPWNRDYLRRGRPTIALDLKSVDGAEVARELIAAADVLIEGFRPGVMERLGLGPDAVAAINPRLVYTRMTGWGQSGPLSHAAGHDINYLALTGALHLIGPADRPPVPPVNLVGDYGGGGMFAVVGILAALLARASGGRGQTIDAAMVDGSSMLMTQIFSWSAMGAWRPEREANLLDGGAYFYRCYATSDDRYMAVGALEPAFHDAMLRGLGLDPADYADRLDPAHWPARAERIAAAFATRTRDEWATRFADLDACVTPVLTMEEAVAHPANLTRHVHCPAPGGTQPAFAPRLDRTPGIVGEMPGPPGADAAVHLARWGIPQDRIDQIMGAMRPPA